MSLPEESGPLFLLSLDGGGIRGVSELVMLDRIMRRLQAKAHLEELPRPCDYFDLIGGTSTGGLIALLLGRLQMTTEEALETYDEVAETLFSRSNRKPSTTTQFKATTLQEIVERIVARRSDSDLLKYQNAGQRKGKAFVCTIDEAELGSLHRLRTYDTGDRPDEGPKDCKVWEAARATTAAPGYFKPMSIESDSEKKKYLDAGLGFNNPVEELLDEACSVFHRERTLGALVSLGAGTRQMSLPNPGESNGASYLIGVVGALKSEATDSERAHQRVEARLKRCPDTSYRFNVPGPADEVSLAEWRKMGKLKAMTTAYVENEAVDRKINDLAELLSEKRKPEGLTLKYIGLLFDRKDFLKCSQRAQAMGSSSNFFTGRSAVLESLDYCFSLRRPGDRQRREFLVCGMGGAGKTQIGLKFVETRGDQLFKHCFWIDATDIYTAQEGYEQIAPKAFPVNDPSSVSMKEVQEWMASLEEEWLLVLDNSNSDDIREFVPPGKTGNILYTSRRHNLAASLRPDSIAEVNDMETDDAITLLLLAAGYIQYHPERRGEASPVVQDLGHLPLAIDQAGAYIRRMKISLIQYLDLFREQREQLLRDPSSKDLLRDPIFKGRDPRNQAVYTTFDISFNALRDIMEEHEGSRKGEDARNALNILRLICFYHNETVLLQMFQQAAIGRAVLEQARQPLGQGKDSMDNLLAFESGTWDSDPAMFGLLVLEDFSLVKWDDQRLSVSMHVLVYEWARASIGNRYMARRATYAKTFLFDSMPFDESLGSFSYRRRIYPHVEACMRRAEMSQEDDGIRAQYLIKLGVLYQQRGQFRDARKTFRRATSLSRLARGPDDATTLKSMTLLSALEVEDGKLGEAEFVLLQVLELRQMKIDEIEKRQLSRAAHHLEPIQQEQSPEHFERLKRKMEVEAQKDAKRLKQCRERKGVALQQLCRVYILQSMWDAAEQAILQVIEIYEDVAPMVVEGAKRLLARIRAHRDGDPSPFSRLSVEEARRVLDETIRECGYAHERTMTAMRDLVEVESGAGNAEAAQEVANEFFAACIEVHGQDHRETLRAIHAYSECLLKNQQAIAAETYSREILATSQRTLGRHHPDSIQCLELLGMAICSSGRFAEGLALCDKALEERRAIYCASHASVRAGDDAGAFFRCNLVRANAETARRIARTALRNNHAHLGRTLVEDQEFEQWADDWARFNHLAQFWDTGLPEQVYFRECPPLVSPPFVAEMEEQEGMGLLTRQLEHGSLEDDFA